MADASLARLLAGTIVAALNAYALTGGADFGGGVWDLLASGPRRRAQRDLIAHAIAPIWEANHVWLILAVVLLFTCFPPAFARLTTVLHIPLTLVLIGIVLRGSAFTFRSYDSRRDRVQRRWGIVFASASVVTPLLLGVAIGAIATGRVVAPTGSFITGFVRPWATPFTAACGLLTLALFAFLAATYLTVEAETPALAEDFRRRALWSGAAAVALAAVALVLARAGAPRMQAGLIGSAWSLPLHAAALVAAAGAATALARRHYRVARVAAAALVSLVIWGWAAAQLPWIVPPDLGVIGAASPVSTLRFTLAGLAAGGLILTPSMYYLFRVFKGSKRTS